MKCPKPLVSSFILLQQFSGHTHSAVSIGCLGAERRGERFSSHFAFFVRGAAGYELVGVGGADGRGLYAQQFVLRRQIVCLNFEEHYQEIFNAEETFVAYLHITGDTRQLHRFEPVHDETRGCVRRKLLDGDRSAAGAPSCARNHTGAADAAWQTMLPALAPCGGP